MTAPTPEEFERHLHEGPTRVEFILARVSEWEAAASPGGSWRISCPFDPPQPWHDIRDVESHMSGPSHAGESAVVDDDGETVVYDEGRPTPAEAAHITLHDPARVLAQCAAYRTIVERAVAHRKRSKKAWKEYSRWLQGKPVPEPGTPAYASDGDVSKEHDAILRALATIWADHADYDERWRD